MADWNSLLADPAGSDEPSDAPARRNDEAAPGEGAASPSPRGRTSGRASSAGASTGRGSSGRGSSGRGSSGRGSSRRSEGAGREVSRADGTEDGIRAGREHDEFGPTAGRKAKAAKGRKREGQGAAAAAADPYEQARSIVLRQLTGAARSRRQLADKLAEREIPEDVAQAVLDRFEEVHLIDDAEFARMWVRSRSRTRSLARGALRRELSEKGITGDMADEALAEIDDDDEHAAAAELVRRKLPSRVDLGDRTERDRQTRRLVSMLARRGYAPGLAYRVVGEVFGEELEQLAELEP